MDASSRAQRPARIVPWVEKYRPATVSDVSAQDEVVRTLQTVIATKNLPHLLLYGPPGTGKTSTALALAKELYGDCWRERTLELNASDERGIKVVREKIKLFAQSTVSRGTGPDGSPLPTFKLIILDEADSMTSDAQSALRRVIEAHTRVTRFALVCNYVSRVIDPLASRCAKYRFRPLGAASMTARLEHVCREEGLTPTDSLIPAILEHSGGDMRKAITFLQSAAQFYEAGQPIDGAVVVDIAGAVPVELLQRLWEAMRANNFNQLEREVDDLVANGYPLSSVLAQMQRDTVTSADLTDSQKARICLKLAQVDKCLTDGADEALQMLDAAAEAMHVMAT